MQANFNASFWHNFLVRELTWQMVEERDDPQLTFDSYRTCPQNQGKPTFSSLVGLDPIKASAVHVEYE